MLFFWCPLYALLHVLYLFVYVMIFLCFGLCACCLCAFGVFICVRFHLFLKAFIYVLLGVYILSFCICFVIYSNMCFMCFICVLFAYVSLMCFGYVLCMFVLYVLISCFAQFGFFMYECFHVFICLYKHICIYIYMFWYLAYVLLVFCLCSVPVFSLRFICFFTCL